MGGIGGLSLAIAVVIVLRDRKALRDRQADKRKLSARRGGLRY